MNDSKENSLTEKQEAVGLLIVLFVGAAIRMACIISASYSPSFRVLDLDAEVYHEWAENLALGGSTNAGTFEMAPLYPYAISILYRITGPNPDNARAMQFFLGILIIIMTWLLARRFVSAGFGLLCASMVALCGPLILYEQVLISSTIVTFLILGSLICLEGTIRKNAAFALAAGLCAGGAALGQPGLLIMPPATALVLIITKPSDMNGKSRTRIACLVLLGAFLAVAPVTIRNFVKGGEFVPVSSNAGMNFYIGNHPKATGMISTPFASANDPGSQMRMFRKLAEKGRGRSLSPNEISAYWFEKTFHSIGRHPAGWIGTMIKKTLLFINRLEVPNVLDFELERRYQPPLYLAFVVPGILIPLALLGMIPLAGIFRGRIILVPVLCAWLVCILFFVSGRFRAPVLPLMCISAGYGLWTFYRTAILHRRKKILQLAGLIIAFTAIVHYPVARADRGYEHFKIGSRAHLAGMVDVAETEYSLALSHRPLLQAINNLALLKEQTARKSEALRYWKMLEAHALSAGNERLHRRAIRSIKKLKNP